MPTGSFEISDEAEYSLLCLLLGTSFTEYALGFLLAILVFCGDTFYA
jgi:hypothetical protein